MEKIKKYFADLGVKRLVMMIIGNVVLGFGISIFKFAGMGNDPYSAHVFAVSDYFGFYFPVYQICFNAACFILFELTLGRKYIGLGTLVNMFLLGYIVDFFHGILTGMFSEPVTFIQQLPVMIIGVVITCLGIALYQAPNVGVSPYDSISIIMSERIKKLPYFWARMITDSLCALVCFLCGGLLGLGTIVCAFGLGPIVQFFTVKVAEPLLGKKA